jgi:hypothetical protein
MVVDRRSPLLAAIIALMLGGVILSLAASPPVATRIGLDPFHFFNRHVLFLLPSFIVLIGVSFLSPRQIRRTALIVFAVSIALIVATLLFGAEVKGSRRWITLLGVNIQASESAKPAFVVLAAWLFAESARRPEMPATSMALVLLLMLVSLLVMEPDFGQTMLILMVWGALFFIAGMRMIWVRPRRRRGAGLFGAYLLVPHVAGRIKRFMNPASGDTFQVDTAMEAFCNGGWFGSGRARASPSAACRTAIPISCSRWRRGVRHHPVPGAARAVRLHRDPHAVARLCHRGHVRALCRVRPCDPVRRAGRDQHGGQSAADPGQGHDAAVHLLWRLVDDLAGLRRRHDAGADAAAPAHRDGGTGARSSGSSAASLMPALWIASRRSQ